MNRTSTGTGVNLPALRSHNAALVLDLLRTAGEGGISRLELAERTGLTPQAVSKITARLRADGLVAEAGRRASTGGKPRTVLRLVPDAGYAVGLHLDRDELTAVLVDLAGSTVAARSAPLDFGAGAEAVVAAAVREVGAVVREVAGRVGEAASAARENAAAAPVREAGALVGQVASAVREVAAPAGEVASAVREASAEDRVREVAVPVRESGAPGPVPAGRVLGVGVAAPGPLDHRRGVLHRVTGFPQWDGFALRDVLGARLGLPVVVDKDTNAAALGLALRARPSGGSFAYLHLGTGLGAGLVLGGALYRGARTGAGEFGHQTLQLDGPACDCGGRGCIEALCLAAVARGDIAEAARVLGAGAANLVGLLDIDRVLLGGRVVAAHEEVFVRGVGEVLGELARREGGAAAVPVAVAGGGHGYGVAEGAAQLVLAPVFGHADVAFPG
ncbi:ROK family transcriptional regulator [Streptomyces sp. ISL-98]|uniref:ROK family transcriptional regulator n=1 Tax=Streptomyces sp. ISL-98 TaxID=2819192 RepID=UPI001BE80F9C|nr:ROK family transcriptional regulator [Streptomyces sp. ISL-98]MBT2508094.1 ROK family transcriptional regulator [Streptomyces sp. ISL-98]